MINNSDDEHDDDAPPPSRARHTLLTYLESVVDVLADLPARHRLTVLELVWLGTAAEATSDALALPGGYEAERGRQLAALATLTTKVAEHKPDLEWERMVHEEDWEGLEQHLEKKYGGKGQ